MESKTYVIIGVVAVVIIFLVYYLIFRKKEKQTGDDKQTNLKIALRSGGYISEDFDTLTTIEPTAAQMCTAFKPVITAYLQIYKNVIGKEFSTSTETVENIDCSTLNTMQDWSNLANKLNLNDLFSTLLIEILKRGKEGYEDLSAMYILYITQGVTATIKKEYRSKIFTVVQDENGNVKTIKMNKLGVSGELIELNPSQLIKNIDQSSSPSNPPQYIIDIKTQAKISSKDINVVDLRNDTNPNITIDKLARILTYQLSITGGFN
jgi:hypothetical protein